MILCHLLVRCESDTLDITSSIGVHLVVSLERGNMAYISSSIYGNKKFILQYTTGFASPFHCIVCNLHAIIIVNTSLLLNLIH